MRILELFAGSRSFSKEAIKQGHETYTSDYKQFEGIDYVTDILDFDIKKLPWRPDVIWASPPCTYFSVASLGKHWHRNDTPKSKEAETGCLIVQKTLSIIQELGPDYYFIENPRGKLRHLHFMQRLPRTTITYCSYGDKRMKPTDIWSNLIYSFNPYLSADNRMQGWKPRPMCKAGSKCHEPAPRGSKTGTQGLKNNYERSKVPSELCKEILMSI